MKENTKKNQWIKDLSWWLVRDFDVTEEMLNEDIVRLNIEMLDFNADIIVNGIGYIVGLSGADTEFVGALPTALMKSLSGSGANGLMIDTMKELGPDSFVGRMSCVVRGASDTTFYILAVYFGSVGITKTRNAVTCGLIADFSGIIAAILISYLFFF